VQKQLSTERNIGAFATASSPTALTTMEKSMAETVSTPTKGKYIGVWIIASICSSIPAAIAGSILGEIVGENAISPTQFWLWFTLSQAVTVSIGMAVFGYIYTLVPDLKISKVMPWLWAFGCVGVIWATVKFYGALRLSVRDPLRYDFSNEIIGHLLIAAVVAFFSILTFGWYFRTRHPNRY
jgi:MFS family permease